MKQLPRLGSAEPVIHGVPKTVLPYGDEGALVPWPVIAGDMNFTWLRTVENFDRVRVDEYGHSIDWFDDEGYGIDFEADEPRRGCERQVEVHKLMTA